MWYNSHKDRAGVSEFFFWYQLTRVVLVKGPLNGLFLLLQDKSGETLQIHWHSCYMYVWTADLNTWIAPLSDAAAMLCAESQNVIVLICPPCLLYVYRDRLVALRPSSRLLSHIFTVPSFEHVAKYVWSSLTRTLQWRTVCTPLRIQWGECAWVVS